MIPPKTSAAIRRRFGVTARGWGSIRVRVECGRSQWDTSIFPDKKAGAYILPLKADIRKAENIRKGHTLKLRLHIR